MSIWKNYFATIVIFSYIVCIIYSIAITIIFQIFTISKFFPQPHVGIMGTRLDRALGNMWWNCRNWRCSKTEWMMQLPLTNRFSTRNLACNLLQSINSEPCSHINDYRRHKKIKSYDFIQYFFPCLKSVLKIADFVI